MDDDIKSNDVNRDACRRRQRTAVVLTDLFLLNDVATMHMETATATQ
jgi:hypothetical protein